MKVTRKSVLQVVQHLLIYKYFLPAYPPTRVISKKKHHYLNTEVENNSTRLAIWTLSRGFRSW